jgi:ring-1,2-phenylacetyl-CoA epoxidase subunit PaaE
MAKFFPLKVADIRKETSDCVSVAFEIPENLKNEFKYIQGQYVTLKLFIDNEEIRRSYSICSSPVADNELRIAAKKVYQGKGSGFLNDLLKVGDQIEVMTPMGNFHTSLNPSNKKNYVLFAGGSGITPMLSILKSVLKSEPDSRITLLYGNLNEDAIIFKSEIEKIAAENADRLQVIHIMVEPKNQMEDLYKGLMTSEKVKALIKNHVDLNLDNEFFICGPTPMMKNVEEALASLQIPKNKVHLEYFTATLDAAKTEAPSSDVKITSHVTIIMDGNETIIELNSDGPCILDAALDADLDVPFACKGAVCCTCRAKVLEGKVKMNANFALTQEEVDEGFILTCQSHPITPTVVVDYDV